MADADFPYDAVATLKYKAPPGATDGLSFAKGESVTVLRMADESGDWLVGRNADGQEGMFPEQFVERQSKTAASDVEPAAQEAATDTPASDAQPADVTDEKPASPAPKPQSASPARAPAASSSFRDRIAAFNRPAASPPPIRSKPAAFQRTPKSAAQVPVDAPPVSQTQLNQPTAQDSSATDRVEGVGPGFSASDAKQSITKGGGGGGSLKDRIAALQGLKLDANAPTPPGRAPPKPWKKPSLVSPSSEVTSDSIADPQKQVTNDAELQDPPPKTLASEPEKAEPLPDAKPVSQATSTPLAVPRRAGPPRRKANSNTSSSSTSVSVATEEVAESASVSRSVDPVEEEPVSQSDQASLSPEQQYTSGVTTTQGEDVSEGTAEGTIATAAATVLEPDSENPIEQPEDVVSRTAMLSPRDDAGELGETDDKEEQAIAEVDSDSERARKAEAESNLEPEESRAMQEDETEVLGEERPDREEEAETEQVVPPALPSSPPPPPPSSSRLLTRQSTSDDQPSSRSPSPTASRQPSVRPPVPVSRPPLPPMPQQTVSIPDSRPLSPVRSESMATGTSTPPSPSAMRSPPFSFKPPIPVSSPSMVSPVSSRMLPPESTLSEEPETLPDPSVDDSNVEAENAPELTEEDEEMARRQRLAARMAALGGMKMGMFPTPGRMPAKRPSHMQPDESSQVAEDRSVTAEQSASPPTSPFKQGFPLGGFALPGISAPKPSVPAPAPVSAPAPIAAEDVEVEKNMEVDEVDSTTPERNLRSTHEDTEAGESDDAQLSEELSNQQAHEEVQEEDTVDEDPVEDAQSPARDFTSPPPLPPARPVPPIQTTATPSRQVSSPPASPAIPMRPAHGHSREGSMDSQMRMPRTPNPRSSLDHVGSDYGVPTEYADSNLAGSRELPPVPPGRPSADSDRLSHRRSATSSSLGQRASMSIESEQQQQQRRSTQELIDIAQRYGSQIFAKARSKKLSDIAAPGDNFTFGQPVFSIAINSRASSTSDTVRVGDIFVAHHAKLKPKIGASTHLGTNSSPHVGVVSDDYDAKKNKIRVFDVSREGKVQESSYSLDNLKDGTVIVFRALPSQ